MLVMKANDTRVAAVFPGFSEGLVTNPVIAHFPSTYTELTFPLKPMRVMDLRMQVSLKLRKRGRDRPCSPGSRGRQLLHGLFEIMMCLIRCVILDGVPRLAPTTRASNPPTLFPAPPPLCYSAHGLCSLPCLMWSDVTLTS